MNVFGNWRDTTILASGGVEGHAGQHRKGVEMSGTPAGVVNVIAQQKPSNLRVTANRIEAEATSLIRTNSRDLNRPARLCPHSEDGLHSYRYARCAVVRGDYVVEMKCRYCGKTDLL
jgi:hypothetical protein